jgi:hypothetical protein
MQRRMQTRKRNLTLTWECQQGQRYERKRDALHANLLAMMKRFYGSFLLCQILILVLVLVWWRVSPWRSQTPPQDAQELLFHRRQRQRPRLCVHSLNDRNLESCVDLVDQEKAIGQKHERVYAYEQPQLENDRLCRVHQASQDQIWCQDQGQGLGQDQGQILTGVLQFQRGYVHAALEVHVLVADERDHRRVISYCQWQWQCPGPS